MNTIVQRLVNSYAILVLANEYTTTPDDNPNNLKVVPETYTLAGTTYPLRELVEQEVARRIIAAIG